MTDVSYRERLLAAPMSRHQSVGVAIAVMLCALDGFDVFAITFAAPAIERELAIGKAALGFVFSAGLIGMAIGSLFMAPLADVHGRRRILIPSLCVMTLGTLWSSLTSHAIDLGLSRFLTGLGVGTMISVINPLVADYANAKRRDFLVSAQSLGFPFGAVIGGLAASAIIPTFGWRALFVLATVMGVTALLLVIVRLPETVPGILARNRDDALDRINQYLRRCGQPAIATLPSKAETPKKPLASLLTGQALLSTVQMTCIYLLFIMSVYFIQSWIPSLIASSGFSIAQAARVSVILNVSGICGGLLLSVLIARFGLKPMAAIGLIGSAISITAFGFIRSELSLLMMMAGVLGFFTVGGTAGLYAVISRNFPVEARASGTGFVIGIGRIGSSISPSIAGLLFQAGFDRSVVCAALALPALIAAIILVKSRLGSYA